VVIESPPALVGAPSPRLQESAESETQSETIRCSQCGVWGVGFISRPLFTDLPGVERVALGAALPVCIFSAAEALWLKDCRRGVRPRSIRWSQSFAAKREDDESDFLSQQRMIIDDQDADAGLISQFSPSFPGLWLFLRFAAENLANHPGKRLEDWI
jgi:hypothetical protein